MSLTQQEKEHYAKRINGLFGGAIHATPDQVTEEAARIADVMFTEICNCHIWLAPFPAVAEAIAADGWWPEKYAGLDKAIVDVVKS